MKPDSLPEQEIPSETSQMKKTFWPEGWWRIMEIRIGIIPLPLYLALVAIIAYLAHLNKVPSDVCTMAAVIALGAFTCAEIGERIPYLRLIGGAAIVCTIVPSVVVYYHLMPDVLLKPAIDFTKYTYFLYLYIASLVVGSILGMDRTVLLRCFLKIFVPITLGTLVAALAGGGVALLLGLDVRHAFFYIIVPIMAGGTGEGAIPLSIGYAQLLHVTQGEAYAQVLPPVILGSFAAMIYAGLLNRIGKRFPHLTGEGRLQPGEHDEVDFHNASLKATTDFVGIAGAAMFAVTLYLAGVVGNELFGLPAPVGMIFLAVAIKLSRAVSPRLQEGSYFVYRWSAVALTYPVLFTNSLALAPWDKLVAACAPRNLLVILTVVTAMTLTGYALAKRLRMYPVDLAIVTACRCSKGGAGDVAILDTANRMQLMPFAQTATRIGGAVTVTLALIALAKWS